jgi:hypothetical protein
MMPGFSGVVFLFLSPFFFPVVISLFGRALFVLLTFILCCATTAAFVQAVAAPSRYPLLWFLLWIAAFVCAVIGIRTKARARSKRAIAKLYAACPRAKKSPPLRGKNRALANLLEK